MVKALTRILLSCLFGAFGAAAIGYFAWVHIAKRFSTDPGFFPGLEIDLFAEFGPIFGAVGGAVLGAIISWRKLSLVRGMICGGLINIFIPVSLILLSNTAEVEKAFWFATFSNFVSGGLLGLIIAYLNRVFSSQI